MTSEVRPSEASLRGDEAGLLRVSAWERMLSQVNRIERILRDNGLHTQRCPAHEYSPLRGPCDCELDDPPLGPEEEP